MHRRATAHDTRVARKLRRRERRRGSSVGSRRDQRTRKQGGRLERGGARKGAVGEGKWRERRARSSSWHRRSQRRSSARTARMGTSGGGEGKRKGGARGREGGATEEGATGAGEQTERTTRLARVVWEATYAAALTPERLRGAAPERDECDKRSQQRTATTSATPRDSAPLECPSTKAQQPSSRRACAYRVASLEAARRTAQRARSCDSWRSKCTRCAMQIESLPLASGPRDRRSPATTSGSQCVSRESQCEARD